MGSMNAGTCPFWSGGLGVNICVPLELQFWGSNRPAARFTSTGPFTSEYIMQTLSDLLLDCRVGFSVCLFVCFSARVEAPGPRRLRWG